MNIELYIFFLTNILWAKVLESKPTSMSAGSLKISSGVTKEGPLSSLQQAPQPSTHRHNGSFHRLLKPTPLGLRFDSGFFFALSFNPRDTEQMVLKEDIPIACNILAFGREDRAEIGGP